MDRMLSPVIAIAFVLALGPTPASAADYLTVVISNVFQTTGTPREIATRAGTCISQNLTAGTTDSELIISSDLEGGTIVARNALEYGGLVRWKIRSRFTVEARDGRFRIEQGSLEQFNKNSLTGTSGWGQIGKWTGSGWKKAEEMFAASATKVAECVQSPPGKTAW